MKKNERSYIYNYKAEKESVGIIYNYKKNKDTEEEMEEEKEEEDEEKEDKQHGGEIKKCGMKEEGSKDKKYSY